MGVLAKARCNEVSLENKTITRLWHLCDQCLNLRVVIFLCDTNLPSAHLVPAVEEFCDVTPLCCYNTKDCLQRCALK